jgi:hypothetical protein
MVAVRAGWPHSPRCEWLGWWDAAWAHPPRVMNGNAEEGMSTKGCKPVFMTGGFMVVQFDVFQMQFLHCVEVFTCIRMDSH